MHRKAVVAGQFYPESATALRDMVKGFLSSEVPPRPALGIVSPHAGYIYSGAIAGQTFARVEVPRRVVILGPNHHGLGQPGAVFRAGAWATPLGESLIDEELTGALIARCPALVADEAAHRMEHSLEVQLPFVQVRSPRASIVPICLASLSLSSLLQTGEALAEVLSSCPDEVLMVASSDMTHYESSETARAKDMQALERIEALDPEGLYRVVRNRGISMCGVLPVVVMLAASVRLGARQATLVNYGNSGDVTGDNDQVVGYAGVVIT
ncbi:MAG: AmmeMemoRadiSam system protein B [Desulfuromonas sp.]|uniref:AmmeMemoRadiSam system protein B n=1 Tax=Desulfuromonas sp. TaxID=892 RepID=UPI000CB58A94|nr:AmmeMemoRadiSam system protein B [Desulfuromonas sp.]PLX81925.1 MAG: AmmeMemoRadiSam system protein B [Desulfuromonas sp.]